MNKESVQAKTLFENVLPSSTVFSNARILLFSNKFLNTNFLVTSENSLNRVVWSSFRFDHHYNNYPIPYEWLVNEKEDVDSEEASAVKQAVYTSNKYENNATYLYDKRCQQDLGLFFSFNSLYNFGKKSEVLHKLYNYNSPNGSSSIVRLFSNNKNNLAIGAQKSNKESLIGRKSYISRLMEYSPNDISLINVTQDKGKDNTERNEITQTTKEGSSPQSIQLVDLSDDMQARKLISQNRDRLFKNSISSKAVDNIIVSNLSGCNKRKQVFNSVISSKDTVNTKKNNLSLSFTPVNNRLANSSRNDTDIICMNNNENESTYSYPSISDLSIQQTIQELTSNGIKEQKESKEQFNTLQQQLKDAENVSAGDMRRLQQSILELRNILSNQRVPISVPTPKPPSFYGRLK